MTGGRLSSDLLVRALTDPAVMENLPARQWTELLRRSRSAMLLPRLSLAAKDTGLLGRLPMPVQMAFRDADVLFAENVRMLRWETNRVRRALFGTAHQPILLKGGAYVLSGLKNGRGRLSTDLDILLAKADLPDVEARLKAAGWKSVGANDYDDHYYREWMHELPPLRHENRHAIIDVHHTILPVTSRLTPDAERLIADSIPIPDEAGTRMLCPEDMVLHAVLHLVYDSDFAGRLRDLLDIQALIAEFSERSDFPVRLIARAKLHGLEGPLDLALNLLQKLLGDGAIKPKTDRNFIPRLVRHAILPAAPEVRKTRAAIARFLLYIRSHWLKMPPFMLMRHLTAKAIRNMKEGKKEVRLAPRAANE